MQLEAEVADGFEHGDLVRPPGREDRAAPDEGLDAAARERADEVVGHGRAEDPCLAAGGDMQHAAVFEDDGGEQIEVGTDGQQLLQGPSCDRTARRPDIRSRSSARLTSLPRCPRVAIVSS